MSPALHSTSLGTQQVLSKCPGHHQEGLPSLSPGLPSAYASSRPSLASFTPSSKGLLGRSPSLFHLILKGPCGEDSQFQPPLMGCRPKMKALKWSDQTSLELALGWASVGEAQRRCSFPGRSVPEWRMGGGGVEEEGARGASQGAHLFPHGHKHITSSC